MPSLIGQSLGRYHILEQLGEGGMAVVYKAYDTRLETDVAVKVIRTENLPQSGVERALKRFEREAKALAKLTYPNIVPIIDYGEYEDSPYLVMKYLPGGTLKQRLGHPMPYQEAARILAPIARALEYAHQHGIVHRDVKPSNILITDRGQPMLSDFGVAKILEADETMDLTGTSIGVGTPEYMAPEQVTSKTADARADIYSLGVVFFELVTGRKPFVADTPMAVLFKQASEPLPRPKQFVPGLPEIVEKVLFKALTKDVKDRYQDAGAFAEALERITQGQAVEESHPIRDSMRSILLRWVAIGLIVVAVAMGSWFLWKNERKANPALSLAEIVQSLLAPAISPTLPSSTIPMEVKSLSTPTMLPAVTNPYVSKHAETITFVPTIIPSTNIIIAETSSTPSPEGLMFFDDFTSTTNIKWDTEGSTGKQENGNYYLEQGYIIAGNNSWQNYSIRAMAKLISGEIDFGIVAHFVDYNHFYNCQFWHNNSWLTISGDNLPQGNFGWLVTNPTGIGLGIYHDIRMDIKDNVITCYLDDIVFATSTDSTFPTGKFGFRSMNTQVDIEKVEVFNLP